jgi:folylpolyglutamate synthase/dihydropteroate synthase
VENHGRACQTADTVQEALEIAARASSRDDLICVTGSFYLVGDTLQHLKKLNAQRTR